MCVITFNICVFLTFFYLVSRTGASLRPTNMKKVIDLNITMIENKALGIKGSRLSCASNCLRYNNSCFSFTYNKQTSNCTLGSSLVYSTPPRSDGIELFTQASYCDKKQNFTQSTKGNVLACLWISDMKLDYSAARTVCKGFNSHLYTIKVIDKLYIMRDEMTAQYPHSSYTDTWVWVGLNDIETKNVYRWEDDGAVLNMSSPYKSQIFHPSQPNNLEDDQRCIAYSSSTYYPLIDYFCNTNHLFICERKIFT